MFAQQEPRLNRDAKQHKIKVLQSIANCDVLDSDPDDVDFDCNYVDFDCDYYARDLEEIALSAGITIDGKSVVWR